MISVDDILNLWDKIDRGEATELESHALYDQMVAERGSIEANQIWSRAITSYDIAHCPEEYEG